MVGNITTQRVLLVQIHFRFIQAGEEIVGNTKCPLKVRKPEWRNGRRCSHSHPDWKPLPQSHLGWWYRLWQPAIEATVLYTRTEELLQPWALVENQGKPVHPHCLRSIFSLSVLAETLLSIYCRQLESWFHYRFGWWEKMIQIVKTHFLVSVKWYLSGLVANHFANANAIPHSFRTFPSLASS